MMCEQVPGEGQLCSYCNYIQLSGMPAEGLILPPPQVSV